MIEGPLELYQPKRLDLPQAEIDRLQREKETLLAELAAKKPPVAAPMPEHGSDSAVGLDPQESRHTSEVAPPFKPSLTGRITADGRKLAGLMSRAKKLEAISDAASEKANAARQAAYTARLELNNYMTDHGLSS